ncbi:MAG: type II toxin-antitoxin system VapC family toxin [Candidatus Competibacteraceae bacterium]
MKLLLDTHVLLWWLDDNPMLTEAVRTAVGERHATVFVSAATVWEIAIKQAIGKLETPGDLEAAIAASRFEPLPITFSHAVAAGKLPRHHDDPFDRMLIAQSQIERLTLVTHDKRLGAYGTSILWA